MAEITQEQIEEVVKATELIVEALDESKRVEDQAKMLATAGTNDLEFGQIDPERTMIVTHLSGYNDSFACTHIRLGYYDRLELVWLRIVPAPLVSETVELWGRIRLGEGMYPVVRFEGCQADDELYATLNGYWLKTR